jgi:excisionase family DNA binding protein
MPRRSLKFQTPAPSPTSASKVLHSVEEAAEILSLGRTTVFGLIRDGLLRTVKIGKRRLVAATEVEAFATRLQEGEVPK